MFPVVYNPKEVEVPICALIVSSFVKLMPTVVDEASVPEVLIFNKLVSRLLAFNTLVSTSFA